MAWPRWAASAASVGSGAVGEDPVVAVDGEHLRLPGCHLAGVEAADPPHDQPGGDVLGLAPVGERGEGDLGDLVGGADSPYALGQYCGGKNAETTRTPVPLRVACSIA